MTNLLTGNFDVFSAVGAVLFSFIGAFLAKTVFVEIFEFLTFQFKKRWVSQTMRGYEASRLFLNRFNLSYIIEEKEYDFHSYSSNLKMVGLSKGVYYGGSITAFSYSLHEVGHALQAAQRSQTLRIRHLINIDKWSLISVLFFVFTLITKEPMLIVLGLFTLCMISIFHLAVLLNEADASFKAIQMLFLLKKEGTVSLKTRDILYCAFVLLLAWTSYLMASLCAPIDYVLKKIEKKQTTTLSKA